ncbi:MAG TPA: hypothetical protein VK206_12785 [Anaerolineales bacterium]|nr:hypothetical protein [Anaerolineales bacterium]
MKRFFSVLALSILIVSLLTAAAPTPNTSIELVEPTPAELLVLNDPPAPTPTLTMNVGETIIVSVQVTSDQEFLSAMALPSFQFPGKGVVAVQGGDHQGRGTSATLQITFQAKSPTTRMPNNVAPVHFVIGVRYLGGYVAVQDYLFNVTVP